MQEDTRLAVAALRTEIKELERLVGELRSTSSSMQTANDGGSDERTGPHSLFLDNGARRATVASTSCGRSRVGQGHPTQDWVPARKSDTRSATTECAVISRHSGIPPHFNEPAPRHSPSFRAAARNRPAKPLARSARRLVRDDPLTGERVCASRGDPSRRLRMTGGGANGRARSLEQAGRRLMRNKNRTRGAISRPSFCLRLRIVVYGCGVANAAGVDAPIAFAAAHFSTIPDGGAPRGRRC